VVLADVLEHLPDPVRVLRSVHSLLNPGARIVVSVPNVAHVSVRAQLLFGRFRYSARGILDRTHLRFFTQRTRACSGKHRTEQQPDAPGPIAQPTGVCAR
jgi:2-polyprenyl-3-methyl-5-hydroxy-6-metoxy-1,4-benzoquinol methylase